MRKPRQARGVGWRGWSRGSAVRGTARAWGLARGHQIPPGRALLAWRTNGCLSGLPFPRFLPRGAGLRERCSGVRSLRSLPAAGRFVAEVVAQGAVPVGYGGVEDGDEEPPAGETGGHHVGAGHRGSSLRVLAMTPRVVA